VHDSRDPGLDPLLDLEGYIIAVGGGYWAKFEAREVAPDESVPHGVRYSLTLHDREGRRVLGYDNAHPLKLGTGPAGKLTATKDHRHPARAATKKPYLYRSAGDLLEDFWRDVDRFLKEEGVR
jgi:hypothetical protein